jgi:hypothetical protein
VVAKEVEARRDATLVVPVAVMFVKLAVVPLKVSAKEVVAFVVEAFRVAKFAVVPQIVLMIAAVRAAKVDDKPTDVVVADTERLVEVAFVIVPFEEVRFVNAAVTADIRAAKRLEVFKLEIVADAIDVVAIVAVPLIARLLPAISPVAVRLVRVVDARVEDPATVRLVT